jgi:hypothetical protein
MKTTMIAAVALWAGMAATSAQAAAEGKPCVTEPEAQAVFLTVAPDVIRTVAQKCAASLPETATLRGGLAAFSAPYDTAAAMAAPQAGAAFAKMARPDVKGIDPAAMKAMIGPMIGGMAADQVKPKDCATIDRAVTLLAPLPPANVAGLIVLAAASKGSGKGGNAPFSICPTPVVGTVPALK